MLKGKKLELEVTRLIHQAAISARQKTSMIKSKRTVLIGATVLAFTLVLFTGVITYHYQKPTEPQITEKDIDSHFRPVPEVVKEKQRNTPLFGCSQIIQKRFDAANEGRVIKKVEP